MLRMTSASVLVLVFGAAAAAADDKTVGPEPLVYTAQMDKEVLNLRQLRYRLVPFTEKVVVLMNGVMVEKVVTVTKIVPEMTDQRIKAEEVKAYTPDGKMVEAKDLAERLKKEVTVLVSADGNKLDPAHLQIVKEGTLILLIPPGTLHSAGAAPKPEKLPEVKPELR
jgi:hypothetical protein